jgi:polar amino acid transport system substrate-binding protein
MTVETMASWCQVRLMQRTRTTNKTPRGSDCTSCVSVRLIYSFFAGLLTQDGDGKSLKALCDRSDEIMTTYFFPDSPSAKTRFRQQPLLAAFDGILSACIFALAVSAFIPACHADDVAAHADENGVQRSLRVVARVIEPFAYVPADGKSPSGFSIDVWEKIANTLGRPCEYLWVKTVDEMLSAVSANKADVAVGALTISSEREKFVDFSHAFFRSGLRIAAPAASGTNWWHTLNRFLAVDLLGLAFALGTMTMVTSNLLWFVERKRNPEAFPRAYLRGVGEALWWSVSTVITGGCENKAPVTILGRIISVVWMLGGIVLVATFTATLASRMTAETISAAISGPEDLPGRRIATIANTAVVGDMQSRLATVLPCEDLSEAVRAVIQGRADVVVYDSPILANFIERNPDSGVYLVGPLFEHQYYGFAVPADSPLREAVNQVLLELDETGELAKLNQRWFGERE